MAPQMPEPWTVTRSEITFEDPWLKVRSDRCVTGAGRVVEPFHVLEYPAWVNVVAITPRHEIVLVREYRHGAGRVLLGLPSGVMDRSDPDVEHTARRELREETGYEGGRFTALAGQYANPANQTNLAHSVLALGVELTAMPCPDPGEEIEVVVVDFIEFLRRFWAQEALLQVSHSAAVYVATGAILNQGDPRHGELKSVVRGAFERHHGLVEPERGKER
jgi:8-oxo-dGTP pyrophosphatase MutT (NUDIX family)